MIDPTRTWRLKCRSVQVVQTTLLVGDTSYVIGLSDFTNAGETDDDTMRIIMPRREEIFIHHLILRKGGRVQPDIVDGRDTLYRWDLQHIYSDGTESTRTKYRE